MSLCVHVVSLTHLDGLARGCLAHRVAFELGRTSKGLREALLRGHSGHQATEFVTIELPAIGKAQSPCGSCHAIFPACFCFGEEQNVCGSREKKKAEDREQRLAAVLDCSHLLLIVAIGIAHAMLATQCKACPTMLCIRLVDYAIMLKTGLPMLWWRASLSVITTPNKLCIYHAKTVKATWQYHNYTACTH